MQQCLHKILQILMFFSKKEPVKFSLLTPLTELSESCPINRSFLPGWQNINAYAAFRFLIIIQISRHLVEHRTFQMNDLIMGNYKNIFLTVCICHGEGHLIVIVLRKYGSSFIYSRKSFIHPIFHFRKIQVRHPLPYL